MECNQDDYLLISGIQHFVFCRRQWALIHIEMQWEDNIKTVEGELMHERVHDESMNQKRGKIISIGGMRVFSKELKVTGICDIVELIPDENGISIIGRPDKYKIRPVEYKHGSSKENDSDRLQLTAQAICLEEMLCCQIDEGALFYGETKHRETVAISDELRLKTRKCIEEMNDLFSRRYTPKVKPSKGCTMCSLKSVCLPQLLKRQSAAEYIKLHINE